MKRGDVVIASIKGITAKPRPWIVVQSDLFAASDNLTVAPTTHEIVPVTLFRVLVEPTAENGLKQHSQVMLDRVMTAARASFKRVGRLDDEVMVAVTKALALYLGIT